MTKTVKNSIKCLNIYNIKYLLFYVNISNSPRQNQKCHGEIKFPTAKPKYSRQKQKAHGKTKKLTAKPKSSRQNPKTHGKTKNLRQNQNQRKVLYSWVLGTMCTQRLLGLNPTWSRSSVFKEPQWQVRYISR